MRIDQKEFEQLELRAHSLLAGVPLHDVWAVGLPGSRSGASMLDVRALFSPEKLAAVSLPVRFLFALRGHLGRLLRWDRRPVATSEASFVQRLSQAERSSSLVRPGTAEGPFVTLYVSPRESISEIQNATVHAFSVLALAETAGEHRLYWAIYVRPVGRITRWYMWLIDPFRRLVIYPAVLRYVRRAWAHGDGSAAA